MLERKIFKNSNLIIVYTIISIILTGFIGYENIKFSSTEWLFMGNDMSASNRMVFF